MRSVQVSNPTSHFTDSAVDLTKDAQLDILVENMGRVNFALHRWIAKSRRRIL